LAGLVILAWAYFQAHLSLNGIAIKREARTMRLEVGKTFSENLEITNNSGSKKLWLQVEDQSKILSAIHSRSIANLEAGRAYQYLAQAQINRRGVYPLGPTGVSSGDAFGIFTTSLTIPPSNHLTVYPHIAKLEHFSLETGTDASGQNQLMQTTRTTPQAAGVREYQPGDPLNRIHWPITLKKDRLMAKEFDEDSQACAWLVLDAQAGIYPHVGVDGDYSFSTDRNLLPFKKRNAYQLPRDGFEYAVSMCASLADYYTRANKAVGFAACGKQLGILPAEKGERQLLKILNQLAVIEDQGTLLVQDLIQKQIRNIPRGSALVVISPRVSNDLSACLLLVRRWGLRAKFIHIDSNTFLTQNVKKEIKKRKETKNLIRIGYGDEISSKLSGNAALNAHLRVSGGSLPRRNRPV